MAIRRYPYSMRHTWITDQEIGLINPIFCQEVTPGDTWSGRSAGIIRAAALNRPAYTQLSIHIHFWFVPLRS